MDRETQTHFIEMKTIFLFLVLVEVLVITTTTSPFTSKGSHVALAKVASPSNPPMHASSYGSKASKYDASAPAPSPKTLYVILLLILKHRSPPAPKHRSPPAPPLDLTPNPAPSPSPSMSPLPPKSKHVSPPAPPVDEGPDEGPAPAPAPTPVQSPLPPKSKHKSPPAPPAHETSAPSPSPAEALPTPVPASGTRLDPKQLTALQFLGVSTVKDPCSPSQQKITVCDSAKTVKHLVSLHLQYCSPETHMTQTAMEALSTLHSLTFIDCPMTPIRLPAKLVKSLTSFTCISSLGRTLEDQSVQGLSGVWLSKLQNLTELTVTDVVVNASGPTIILGNMKHIRDIAISRTNLSGVLPKSWHTNVSSIDRKIYDLLYLEERKEHDSSHFQR